MENDAKWEMENPTLCSIKLREAKTTNKLEESKTNKKVRKTSWAW